MRHSSINRRPAAAFTLTEILVVIGIIAVLIAILMPILVRARRPAVVLASPIAYLGSDSRVHLTDANGRSDLTLTPAASSSCPVCHSAPTWSPSGSLLGLRISDGQNRSSATGILNPATGALKMHSISNSSFVGWMDSSRYVESTGSQLDIVDVDKGTRRTQPNPQGIIAIAPVYSGSPAPYVGAVAGQTEDLVLYLRHDLSIGKLIWLEPTSVNKPPAQDAPRVDPLGDYVGWTLTRGRPYIAIKNVSDGSSVQPTLLGSAYSAAYFCDWTEQSTILANVQIDSTNFRLVVLNRDGSLNRELRTEVPPAPGPIASWRKYMHR